MYPSYRITKGYTKAIIVDTDTHVLNEIPTELYDILTIHNKSIISEAIEDYGAENRKVLLEYFDWLMNKDILYLTPNKDDLDNFQNISNEWDSPYDITNGIIDIDELSKPEAFNRVSKFMELKVPHIELRFFCDISEEELSQILAPSLGSEINSIIIYLPYRQGKDHSKFESLVQKHLRILALYIYSSPEEKKLNLHNNQSQIVFLNKNINDKNCGIVDQKYFISNVSFQRESRHFNTCLNRKISIDSKGNIKNCPSMTKSYGNINDITLEEVLNKQEFKDVWNIKKDDIKICQDCEFRYICPDCRAFIENPRDIYSKPLKCGYDPYTGVWQEWSKNPLKQKAIELYGMEDHLNENSSAE